MAYGLVTPPLRASARSARPSRRRRRRRAGEAVPRHALNPAQADAVRSHRCRPWHVLADAAARRHRQRQDRGLSRRRRARGRARRTGADARARDQPDAAARDARVRDALPGVHAATLHSRLASGARRAQLGRRRATARAQVVLGTRLGVFAPLPQLGLVVVDEEHDDSYKQQDGVRYHARDLAVWRARKRSVPIVLGSATPSLETWSHAQGRPLPDASRSAQRADVARASARDPVRAGTRHATRATDLSPLLRDALAARLAQRRAGLVFINRRGYAPSLKCAAAAGNRNVRAARRAWCVHRQPQQLALPPLRPRRARSARVPRLRQRRPAAARLRHAAARADRSARISRRASRAHRPRHDAQQGRVRRTSASRCEDREVDILVGTQMLAKGHDFPAAHAGRRAGRRQRALQRRLPRHRAARRAADAGGRPRRPRGARGRGDRADRLSGSSGLSRRSRAHDYGRFADELLGERRAPRNCRRRRASRCSSPRRMRARTSIAFSTTRSSARDRCSTATAASKCFRRCRRRWRGARASSAGRCSCKARGARRCRRSCRAGATRSRAGRERARALGARRRPGGVLTLRRAIIRRDMPAPRMTARARPRPSIRSSKSKRRVARIVRELIPDAAGVAGRGRAAARAGARRLRDERRAAAREAARRNPRELAQRRSARRSSRRSPI